MQNLVSVYHDLFGLDEISYFGKMQDQSTCWQTHISRPDSSMVIVTTISNPTIAGSFFDSTQIKGCREDCPGTSGPPWLGAVSIVAKNPTSHEGWVNLQRQLKDEGASLKSLRGVERILESVPAMAPR